MTWKITIKNPDMTHPNRILHGELLEKVGKIFRDQEVDYGAIKVEWEDDEPVQDPYMGRRDEMVWWLNSYIANNFDELVANSNNSFPSTLFLTKILRDEYMDNRGFSGRPNGEPYIELRLYALVAKQVRKGWVE